MKKNRLPESWCVESCQEAVQYLENKHGEGYTFMPDFIGELNYEISYWYDAPFDLLLTREKFIELSKPLTLEVIQETGWYVENDLTFHTEKVVKWIEKNDADKENPLDWLNYIHFGYDAYNKQFDATHHKNESKFSFGKEAIKLTPSEFLEIVKYSIESSPGSATYTVGIEMNPTEYFVEQRPFWIIDGEKYYWGEEYWFKDDDGNWGKEILLGYAPDSPHKFIDGFTMPRTLISRTQPTTTILTDEQGNQFEVDLKQWDGIDKREV